MPNANFGLRSSSGRGNSRQTSNETPWTQTRNRSSVNTASTLDHQTIRSQISTKFHTYCVLALGYDRKKPPPAKPQLARHILSILRMGDDKPAIQPYDKTSTANAICHATHVPNDPAEFAIYFPEFKYYLCRYRTKCRIKSEILVWQIKSKVFASLKKKISG